VRNKDDTVKIHGLLKIFTKIIKEETLMDDAREKYMGYDSIVEPLIGKKDGSVETLYNSHEFDMLTALHSGQLTKDYIIKTQNFDEFSWNNSIKDQFSESIYEMTAEKYATMKASARTGQHTVYNSRQEDDTSIRALTAIKEYIGDHTIGVHPLLNIPAITAALEENGGILATMFRKPQLQGDREIFILTMISRLAINYVELLCRRLCGYLPQELLTKGTQKYGRNSAHMSEVMSELDVESENHMTATNSDDATTWAQKFVMPYFGCFLCKLLPTDMHEGVCRILNLVAGKSLRLPSDLMKLFMSNVEIMSVDAGMAELKRQFLGVSDRNNLIEPNSLLLHNVSNMMQGILHYTSSLCHVGHTIFLDSVNSELFVTLKRISKLGDQIKLVQNSDISSDDSATTITIIHPDNISNYQKALCKYYLILFCCIKSVSYSLMCAQQSYEKSTPVVIAPMKEFNSVWFLYNTMISPQVKFVLASLQVCLEGSLDSRQITQSNLRRQMSENGSGQFTCSVVQIGQSVIHYSCLGMNTNPMFFKYFSRLMDMPLPSLGFFLEEPEFLCGVLGFDFAEYIQLTKSADSDQSRRLLTYLLSDGNSTIDEYGRVGLNFKIKMGGHKRYKDWVAENTTAEDEMWEYEPIMNNRVSTYFSEVHTVEDAKFQIMRKVNTPGIGERFAFKTGSMIMAASSYLAHAPCVTLVKSKLIDGRRESESVKVSLYAAVGELEEVTRELEPATEETIKILFQNYELYDAAYTVCADAKGKNFNVSHTGFRPERFLQFSNSKKVLPASRGIVETVRQKWTGSILMTDMEFDESWRIYSRTFPWLKDTILDTIDDEGKESDELCPFSKPTTLVAFLKSIEQKRSSYKMLCPVYGNKPNLDIMQNLLEQNFVKGHHYRVFDLDSKKYNLSNLNRADLSYILSSRIVGMSKDQIDEHVDELLRVNSDLVILSEYAPTHCSQHTLITAALEAKPGVNLSVFSEYLERNLSVMCKLSDFVTSRYSNVAARLNDIIPQITKNVYGRWVQEQKVVDDMFVGSGIYHGRVNDVNYIIYVKHDVLRRIECTSLEGFMRNYPLIKPLIRSWNLRGSSIMPGAKAFNFGIGYSITDSEPHVTNLLYNALIGSPKYINDDAGHVFSVMGGFIRMSTSDDPSTKNRHGFTIKFRPDSGNLFSASYTDPSKLERPEDLAITSNIVRKSMTPVTQTTLSYVYSLIGVSWLDVESDDKMFQQSYQEVVAKELNELSTCCKLWFAKQVCSPDIMLQHILNLKAVAESGGREVQLIRTNEESKKMEPIYDEYTELILPGQRLSFSEEQIEQCKKQLAFWKKTLVDRLRFMHISVPETGIVKVDTSIEISKQDDDLYDLIDFDQDVALDDYGLSSEIVISGDAAEFYANDASDVQEYDMSMNKHMAVQQQRNAILNSVTGVSFQLDFWDDIIEEARSASVDALRRLSDMLNVMTAENTKGSMSLTILYQLFGEKEKRKETKRVPAKSKRSAAVRHM